LGLVLSLVLHGSVVPLRWPVGLEVRDVEGQADIAIDVLEGATSPEKPPAAEPASEVSAAEPRPSDTSAASTSPALAVDAGAHPLDRASLDGGPAAGDAAADGASDAQSPQLAAIDGGGGDGGASDTENIVGAAGAIQADEVLVVVFVNAQVIRKNPVGVTLGALLRGIPQWADFMSGTDINPVRDADWLMISGPSLVNTGRDVVLIRYAVSDTVVDHAVASVSRRSTGGPIDIGVSGVRATRAFADRAERVILRPASHVLAVVPPAIAAKEARKLVSVGLPAHPRPTEAFYFRFESPHRAVPEIPTSVTELRVRVVPTSDDGADAFAEADTPDAESARLAAPEIGRIITRRNSAITSILTHGLFDHVEVAATGSRVALHLRATRDQLEALATLAAAFLGVSIPEPAGSGSASPASRGPSH
jgi:hypothetical protein